MTRIRYKNLASGLHGRAERCGRRTTIFLVPGLTGAQRKAALRRLRQEARRGCGPRLPVPQLAVALAADRVRVTFRYTGAVIRLHPAGSILPTAAIGCLMVLFVLASVRIIPQPGAAGSGGVPVDNGPGAGGSGPGAVPRVTGPARAGRAGSGASSMLSRALVAWSPGSGAGGTGSESGASGPGSGRPPGSGSGLGSGPASRGMSVRVDASVGAGRVSAGVAAGVGGTGVPVSASAGPSPSQSPSRGASSPGDISVCVNIGPFAGCVGL